MDSTYINVSDAEARSSVVAAPLTEGGASIIGVGDRSGGLAGVDSGLPKAPNPATPNTTLGSQGASAPETTNEAGNLIDFTQIIGKRIAAAQHSLSPEHGQLLSLFNSIASGRHPTSAS